MSTQVHVEPKKQLISINEVIEKTLKLEAHHMKVNNTEPAVCHRFNLFS